MKLKQIFIEALKDLDTSPMPGMNNGQVLFLPNTSFVISVFKEEKKLLFTPQDHNTLPPKIKEFVYSLKEYFNISNINHKEEGIFEIEFDPRQDFNQVMVYVKEQMGVDEGL
jgi:hypothetical protein